MPIAELKPTAPTIPQPDPVEAQKETYLGIAADNQETPIEEMVAYLEGMPWAVDYYRQLLGKHSNLQELDPGMNASQQQYECVKQLELRVQNSLSPSYDQEQAITTVTGTAIIYHVVPNKADYFIAEAGTRELGLYIIRSVERRTFNRNSAYQIDYELVCYIKDNQVLYQDITSKTVRNYWFSKDRLTDGMAPVLREEDYVAVMDYQKTYQDLVQTYFKTFFTRAQMTLLIPGQNTTIYDAWLVDFLKKIIDGFDARELREMKQISLDNDTYMAQGCLWTVLIDRRYGDVKRVHDKATLASRYSFNQSSWLRGPVYWSVDQYVYPALAEEDKIFPNADPTLVVYDPVTLQYKTCLEDPAYQSSILFTFPDGTTTPLAYSVTYDDYYVLSSNFYNGTTSQSVLELLIRDYLKSTTLDRAMLNAVLTAYPDWPILERFYFGPLLLLLLKEVLRGIY